MDGVLYRSVGERTVKGDGGVETMELAGTSRKTTRLGFGCSSLMGAVGRKESLRLLEAAYAAGMRHFDVAPMYGYGAAEECLGEFLSGHHGDVTVTTKYGIPPPGNPGLMGVARKIVGPVVTLVPGLKSKLARAASSVTASNVRASFTAAAAQASLERSLTSLRTERIDVWLLHEVEASELQDDGLLQFLEDSVARGLIGTFGIGSERHKVPELLRERTAYCRVQQYEWSILDATIGETEAFRIHYRALTENFRRLHAALVGDSATCDRWSGEVGMDLSDREVLSKLMLKAALVENAGSVILVSSKNPKHIESNVRVEGDEGLTVPARRLHALVQAEGVPGRAVAA